MLKLDKICVSFRRECQDKLFGHTKQQVLFDVSAEVKKGTCLGILGESGSGKSTMGRVLCGLLKPDSGTVFLNGVSVYGSKQGRKNLQDRLSIVFQDYTTSANPRFRVADILKEGLFVRQRRERKKLNQEKEIRRLLELVGLSYDFAGRFPHELSGGQLQRICIARAVACNPELILFDEAISSLDAHTQVQIMDLLLDLKEKLGLTYIFITHDLTSITYLCDDVLFLYQGRVTEYLPVKQLSEAKDIYARKLLESIIVLTQRRHHDRLRIRDTGGGKETYKNSRLTGGGNGRNLYLWKKSGENSGHNGRSSRLRVCGDRSSEANG